MVRVGGAASARRRRSFFGHWARSRPQALVLVVGAIAVVACASVLYRLGPAVPLEETGRSAPSRAVAPEVKDGGVSNLHLDARSERPSPIPHVLMFTYSHNILETKEPALFHENVQRTINMYRSSWGEPNATVMFLDNPACRQAVEQVYPALVPHFDAEEEGKFKGDICRVAALYLWGGFYFDVDLRAVKPLPLSRGETFVTVLERAQRNFFQAFLASVPGDKILLESLRIVHAYYEGNHTVRHNKLGPSTLKDAFDAVGPEHRRNVRLLQEIDLRFKSKAFPDLPRQQGEGCCCNYVVHDGGGKEVYFFSRLVGAGRYCAKGAIAMRLHSGNATA